MLLSLAGIPLTAGFLAKFYVVAAGASSALWTLILVLVVTSGIGVYYYLRVIVAIFSGETGAAVFPPRRLLPGSCWACLRWHWSGWASIPDPCST